MAEEIEKTPLRALFWRDEILQVLYWMKGEGFGKTVKLEQVVPLLNSTTENIEFHLNKLVTEGFLKKEEGVFELTEMGNKEAGRRFSDAFSGLQKAGHGECGPDCEFCYGTDGVKLENCVHNCGSSHP